MNHIHMRTWAEIDLNAAEYNYKIIRANTNSKICCVVKADAYGHGAVELSKLYQELGADFLAVSNIEEALQLRNSEISLPILILGYTPPMAADLLADNNISQCVYSLEYARMLSSSLSEGKVVKIHIKIDTGMSRLGFFCQDIERDYSVTDEICETVALPGLEPEGIFTHFAVADEGEKGKVFTEQQIDSFLSLIDDLSAVGVDFEYRHCANSAAILDYKSSHLNMVRAGIVLYGLAPSSLIDNQVSLKPILTLKTIVSHIKTIPSEATVSYGRTYTSDRELKIATIPVGYADGYFRRFSASAGSVLIKAHRCKILGRICMDQLMVDVTDIENLNIGDEVVLIGSSGFETITCDDIAYYTDTINYEIVCGIGARVPRVYLKNNSEIAVLDYIFPGSGDRIYE